MRSGPVNFAYAYATFAYYQPSNPINNNTRTTHPFIYRCAFQCTFLWLSGLAPFHQVLTLTAEACWT
jgi:hypothetical protein